MDIITNPLITILLVLYALLGENVMLAIVVFTAIVRMAILSLTIKQQRSMKKMQELSPKLKKLQEKYKDDRERLVQEQMTLYREAGVNPLAGCLPLLVQLPILFGLWRAIIATLASTPTQLLELENRILLREFWEGTFSLQLDSLIPMNNTFLWLNLAVPDPYYVLPVLVVITTYLQQKLLMPLPKEGQGSGKGDDPADQAARMTRQMTTFMPLLIGFFALTYSSGLSVYFITSNIIGIIQYSLMGRADFRRLIGREAPDRSETAGQPVEAAVATAGAGADGGSTTVEKAPQRRLKSGFTETRLSPSSGHRSPRASSKSKSSGSSGSRSKSGKKRSSSKSKKRR